VQGGGLTARRDAERPCGSFLIWPAFDRDFGLQMGEGFCFI